MNARRFLAVLSTIALVVASRPIVAQDVDADQDSLAFSWPSIIEIDSGRVTIYQPQVDSMNGQHLYTRAAVSYTKMDEEPVFGVAIFDARIEVDRDERTVDLVDVRVTNARFQGSDQNYTKQLDELVQAQMAEWVIILSLDELLTSLDAASDMRKRESDLKMEPPHIVYEKTPAILVRIDGDPVLTEIENSSTKAVINTPYPLLFTGTSYYLNPAKNVWYKSSKIEGPWQFDASPPDDVTKLVPPPSAEEAEESDGSDETSEQTVSTETITAENAPKIVVATEPTELIVTEGDPKLEPISGGLRAVTNTESSLFYDGNSLLYYVVLSGRWYRAGDLAGPWSNIGSDELPSGFSRIPTDSKYAGVRVYVAGTDEAGEAVVNSYIPQTASVERGQVDLDVEYDGDPKFEHVENTELEYAVNSGDSIIKSEDRYYLVRDGVWYFSNKPDGPWEVSDHVPEGVEDIPPSNPTYNVKYVYVYESTPQVVYVGYTPGYVGSYVYGPTIVYGTGWVYHPWVTPYYYYPRYPTWGYHVTYNPWTGWGVGMSWSSGPFRFSFYSGGYWHHRHGWYHRPYGYHRRYPPYHHHRPHNRYRTQGQRARIAHNTRPTNRAGRPGVRPATRPSTRPSTQPSTRKNNVYAGRDGNVYRRDNNGGWSKNQGGSWSSQGSASTRDRSTTNQLNGQQHSRDRSATRNNQYRSSGQSSYGGSRSGSRGGGGRRR